MKKQTYDLEERLLIIARRRDISILQPSAFNLNGYIASIKTAEKRQK